MMITSKQAATADTKMIEVIINFAFHSRAFASSNVLLQKFYLGSYAMARVST